MIAIGYAALALLLPAASLSQPVAPPRTSTVDALADSDEIVVTGFSKPYKLTGKQLATALKVFRKYRPVYAPDRRWKAGDTCEARRGWQEFSLPRL